ncbi:MAG: deoxyribose-phosphate aldolase [Candidatus Terrybacteria bacterium RIFCSPLOWO2_01_FULL_58_14]|uniref:Deoxyribose-phosphate aldolase n=1 Tax=Candidatus Terrybacteria bacterium RIFCSPLOWO2_01_FULL_58_14 TaxID=1802369 RepID=A0A1G2Q0T0_9BACT|nr:MAG: deoxyribose-phosphate aldolase [Candidatus Terrybacteria bacterium RIFCSPLOWO2_01_FULL_58_14]
MQINKPLGFDASRIARIRINASAVARRAATLATRRTFKQEAQAAAYLRIIECLDLTELSGDDTPGRIERLCAKARRPVEPRILSALTEDSYRPRVGAVCVYHDGVVTAVQALRGSGIPVAAVSTGFPTGKIPHDVKLALIDASIRDGATEIDVVIDRAFVLTGQWHRLYNEIVSFRHVCGNRAKLKTIIGRGDLGTLEDVARATACAIMAGSDFVKTSTGYEPTNADLLTGLVMVRQIREFYCECRCVVGFKPAGGIRVAKDAMSWLILMREELGDLDPAWITPKLFRIGASKLLNDLEQQLEHCATGSYSAPYYHPLG